GIFHPSSSREGAMKRVLAAVGVTLSLLAGFAAAGGPEEGPAPRPPSLALASAHLLADVPTGATPAATPAIALASLHPIAPRRAPEVAIPALEEVVQRNCAGCHSDQRRSGNLSL